MESRETHEKRTLALISPRLTIHWLAVIALLCSTLTAFGQASGDQPGLDEIPATRQLAAALSDPSSRNDALLTLLATARMLQITSSPEPQQMEELEESFRDDRSWLDRLAQRYDTLPTRSSILDSAAWFVQQELGQHDIVPNSQVAPLGPEFGHLRNAVFDRSEERLAAAFLPGALFHVELMSTRLWQQVRKQAASDSALLQLLTALNEDWFEPWMAAEPPAPASSTERQDVLERSMQSMQVLMESVMLPEPPDELRVRRLKFSLLTALPEMNPAQARNATHLLRLTAAVDGLNDYRYLEFIQSLLWVVTDLLEMYGRDTNAYSPLPSVLAEFLPRLSSAMSRQFAEVDSRFNAQLAAAFDVVQDLHSGELSQQRLAGLQLELADSVSQLVLLVPDMAFYFDQPVRRRISEEIDICISLAADRDESGNSQMSRVQFDRCIRSLVDLADNTVRGAELSGDPNGPFGADQVRRELELTPWQRINYTLGYLHEQSTSNCPMPARPLPNPLEWSALATLTVWFAHQSPVYFKTPDNEKRVNDLLRQGRELLRSMSQQLDCINSSGSGVSDLISAELMRYRTALDKLIAGIREAELAFRQSRLRPGADVVLSGGISQETSYRTPGLMIAPCSSERVCEMTTELEATRALIGLFPDEYLLADQTGLGRIEICYDNMQWIDRRAEPVRPEDPNVANYHGRLSFELVGRYREGGATETIFASRIISPDEYHYLIAAATDEVLEDGCPTEWVGKQIVTSRGSGGGFTVVPDRLTYLAAARSRPSEVISANWSRGAEWRDWFVTGLGVTEIETSPQAGIRDRLAQHLRLLYQAERQAVYSRMLRPASRAGSVGVPLNDLMNDVTMYKSMVRSQMLLFYPEFMLDSEAIRAGLEGQQGLLDETLLRRFRDNNVAISRIHDSGLARWQQFLSTWKSQPEAVLRTGSVATSLAHAMARLKSLEREFFAAPTILDLPAPVAPAGVSAAEDATGGSATPGW